MIISRFAAPIAAVCMIVAMFLGLFSCDSCGAVSDSDLSPTYVASITDVSDDVVTNDGSIFVVPSSNDDEPIDSSKQDEVSSSDIDVDGSSALGGLTVSTADILAEDDEETAEGITTTTSVMTTTSTTTTTTTTASSTTTTTATTTTANTTAATTTTTAAKTTASTTTTTFTAPTTVVNGPAPSFEDYPALCVADGSAVGESGTVLLVGERAQRGKLALAISAPESGNVVLIFNNYATESEVKRVAENYPEANIIYTYRQNRAFFVKLNDGADCDIYNCDGTVYLESGISRPAWIDSSVKTATLNSTDIYNLSEKLSVTRRFNAKPFLVEADGNDVYRYFPGI